MRWIIRSLLVTGVLGLSAASAQADDSIAAWGYNLNGQCELPEPNRDFVAVSSSRMHTLALRRDGTIVAWGLNDHGQCDMPDSNSGFIAVSAGYWHSLALRSDGRIEAWGANDHGQCAVPTPNSGFTAIAAGCFHSLAIRADSLVGWGWNDGGQATPPTPNRDITAIAGGGFWHSLALRRDGTVAAMGPDWNPACHVPEPNENFVAIDCGGGDLSMALRADSSIVVWGDNRYGQVDSIPLPNTGCVGIAAGWWHCLGLRSDGTVHAWGLNNYHQCDVPCPNVGFTRVEAGDSHSMAIRGEEVGACCLIGYCTILTQAGCWGYGGWFLGDGYPCQPNPCPPSEVAEGTAETRGLEVISAPNPSTGDVHIEYAVPTPGAVVIGIFDGPGRLVRRFAPDSQTAGRHTVQWDARDGSGRLLPAGIYLIRAQTPLGLATSKVTIAR